MKSVFLLVIAMFLAGSTVNAQSLGTYLVLGAIGSDSNSSGVVLLKKRQNDAAFAVKVGVEVEKGIRVLKISDRYVYFKRDKEIIRVKIGEEIEQSISAFAQSDRGGEIEVRGNRVVMSAKYKDHLVNNELNKVLMQAAAVPYYQNGVLEGFKVVDIDHDSIYDQVGLKDGDIVTEINGQKLSDVAMAIKVLNAMRYEKFAEIKLMRSGVEKNIEINVQ